MDTLGDMTAFVRVVEARTFTAAAQRLGWSKSVVSRRLAELEERLGARLLNRSTRRLSLTEAGRAYYDRCVRILADIEETEASVASLHAEPRGQLSINAPMSFGMLHLPSAIAEFMASYPEVGVDLVLNDRFVDLVEEGVDLAIRLTLNDRFVDLIDEGYDLALRIGTLADSALYARKLAACRRVLAASPDYLARHGEPRHPGDLAHHECLVYSMNSNADIWRLTGPDGQQINARIAGRLSANNGDVLRDVAVAGGGIVLSPTFLICDQLADGSLVPVLTSYGPSDIPLHAVYPHNRHLSAKVRAFVDFLAARFAPDPPWEQAIRDRAAA